MSLRDYLLMLGGIADEEGNRLYFRETSLENEVSKDGLWLFLDEGLLCGGTSRQVSATKEAIITVLIGLRKYNLIKLLEEEILRFEKSSVEK